MPYSTCSYQVAPRQEQESDDDEEEEEEGENEEAEGADMEKDSFEKKSEKEKKREEYGKDEEEEWVSRPGSTVVHKMEHIHYACPVITVCSEQPPSAVLL